MIDALVEDTRCNVSDRLVLEDGIYSKAEGYSQANALVASLSAAQRKVLADVLLDQRKSAISSALALLDWRLTNGLVITYCGEPIPFVQCEGGPHGDYLARCDNWKWLDEDA
jgi:hypothetical protein